MGYYVYRDNQAQYRWSFKSSNGRIISVSSEAYVNKTDCLRSIEIMKTEGSYATVYDMTGQGSAAYR